MNTLTYLGVVLHWQPKNATPHIESRLVKAAGASAGIQSPYKLSLDTAKALFDMKVASVASYGIQVMWEYLPIK